MRHSPTPALMLALSLTMSLAMLTKVETALAQSDAGPADCALEEDWQPGPARAPATSVATWEEEAAAHGAFGSPASFDLAGVDIHLYGAGLVLEEAAPISAIVLHDGVASASDFLFVDNATVGDANGTLVVEGPRIEVTGETLGAAFPLSRLSPATAASPPAVAMVPLLNPPSDLELDLPEEWAAAETASQTAVSVGGLALGGATLSGYARALLVTATGETALTGPLFITSGGAAYTSAAAAGTTAPIVLEGPSFTVSGERLSLAGDFSAGTMTVEDTPLAAVPKLVLVRGGAVVITPEGAAASDVRVTQALDDEGPLLEAAIEVISSTPFVQVEEGGMVYLPAAVREAGFKHDALFAGIEVDGCVGVETVQAVVEENFPSTVRILLDVLQASSWAAPIVAITVITLLPGAMLVDAFADILGDLFCLFGCPEPPPPPKPYPFWLAPGEARPFELVINGDVPPGDYPTRIRFLGQNHEEAELNVLVRVGQGDVPDDWQCVPGVYGTYSGCDCGCGVPDLDCPADAAVEACERTWCGREGLGTGGSVLPDDVTQCLVPPEEWTCEETWFAGGDEVCDCGCGALDPDCPAGASESECSSTWCADGLEGGRLVEGDLAQCLEPPGAWRCAEASYGDGICSCGCGALDMDCPEGATATDCAEDDCLHGAQPNDLAQCLPFDGPDDSDPGSGDEVGESRGCSGSGVSTSEAPRALLVLALLPLLFGPGRGRPRVQEGQHRQPS